MRNIKCADCAEYRKEWCEKVIDSPHPDMLRDCQYFHEKDRNGQEQTGTDKHFVGTSKKGDTIYRADAIDALCKAGCGSKYCGISCDDVKAIEGLPSAQPEQRWIPVTERLPDTDNEVLVTVLDMEDDYVEVYKGFYQDHEWWTQWCHGCLRIKDEPCGANIVTAWLPLPEPWKEGEADD